MSLVGLLPLAHPSQAGQLYLANLGIPKNLFKEPCHDNFDDKFICLNDDDNRS